MKTAMLTDLKPSGTRACDLWHEHRSSLTKIPLLGEIPRIPQNTPFLSKSLALTRKHIASVFLNHRVGRTARAGHRGRAVTIAKKGQVKQFLRMRSGVDEKRLRMDVLPAEQSRLLPLVGRYQRCLEYLKEVLEAEKTGELDPASPVTAVEASS